MSRFEEVVNEAIDAVVLSEALRAEGLAAHIAQQVRERQSGCRAEVRIEARYPEYKRHPRPALIRRRSTSSSAVAVASERGRDASRRRGPGHDRLPMRPGLLAARPRAARRRVRPRARSSASSTPCPSRPTTSAASASSISAPGRLDIDIDARDLLHIVTSSMSSEIYELMKRSDESAVVEKAHRNPRFVEDVVREMVRHVADKYSPAPRRGLHGRPSGEPRDDPPPHRHRRAHRPRRRGPGRDRHRNAFPPPCTQREWLEKA